MLAFRLLKDVRCEIGESPVWDDRRLSNENLGHCDPPRGLQSLKEDQARAA